MAMKAEIEEILQSHSAWRKRFKDFLNGRAPFDLAVAGATDRCNFGQWLDKEGYRLMPKALHEEICSAHTSFHAVAAGIIQQIKEKRYAEARAEIAPQGSLDQASARLTTLLRRASLLEPGATPTQEVSEKPGEPAPAPAEVETPGDPG